METCIITILLKLERAKKCLFLVAQPNCGHREGVAQFPAKGLATVQPHLCRAWEAAQAAAAAAATQPTADYDLVLREAAAAVDALALVTASGTAATEALSTAVMVARALAQVKRQQALGFADKTRQVMEMGDLTAAVCTAVQAKEAAAVAMWAACVGGLQLVTETNSALGAALREADAVIKLVEAASAAAAADAVPGAPDQLPPDGEAASAAADRAAVTAEASATTEAAAAAVTPAGPTEAAAEAGPAAAQASCSTSCSTESPTVRSTSLPAAVASAPAAPSEAAEVAEAVQTNFPAVAAAATRSTAAAETLTRAGVTAAAASRDATPASPPTTTPAEGAPRVGAHAWAAAVTMTEAAAVAEAGAATDAEVRAEAEAVASAGGAMAAPVTAREDAAVGAAADGITAPSTAPGTSQGPSEASCTAASTESAPVEPNPHGTDLPSGESTTAAAGQAAAAKERAANARPCATGPSVPGAAEDGPSSAGGNMASITTAMEGAGDGRIGRRHGDEATSGADSSDGPVRGMAYGAGTFGGILARNYFLSALAARANGEVAPDAVVQAAGAMVARNADFSEGYGHPDDSASMRTAWAEPKTRCGLVRLLSYTVRHLVELQAAATGCDLGPPVRVLELLVSCVAALFCSSTTTSTAQASLAAVARLLVRTDLVQCLSRLFAGMASTAAAAIAASEAGLGAADDVVAGGQAAEAEAVAAANAAGVLPGGGAAAREDPGAPSGSGGRCPAWMNLQLHLIRLLMFCTLRCGHHSDQAAGELAAALQSLRGAILSSRVMEHAVRAVALTLGSMDSSARASAWSGQAVLLFASRLAAFIHSRASGTQRPLTVWADVLLSGPCVQRFLLLHAVSQIANVDGGPSYGLSRLARLPSEVRVPETLAGAASNNRIRLGARPPSFCDASADLTAVSFHWWARNRARPCSDRALRVVCERAAAAASASWAVGPVQPSAGSSLRFDPGVSMDLALAALDCAVALVSGGSAGDLRGLWAPVVHTATAAVHLRPRLALPDLGPLQLLAKLPLPSLGELMAGGDGAFLPPEPSLDLAAALTAGYVPCLERCIRAEMRLAAGGSSSGQSAATVLQCLTSLLQGFWDIASLMAYGDPTAVAALIATSAKAFQAASTKEGADADLLHVITVSVLRNTVKWCRSVGPLDRRWWCHPNPNETGGVATGSAPGAGAAPGTSSGGNSGGSGDGSGRDRGNMSHSGDNSGSGPCAALLPAAPLQRLLLLTTFALKRWLPVLRRLREAYAGGGAERRSSLPRGAVLRIAMAVTAWTPLPVLAYLNCREADAGSQQAAGGAGASSSSGSSDRMAAVCSSSSSSWEQLLLGSVDLPGLMQLACQVMCQPPVSGEAIKFLSKALLHLLVAFPRQGRALLQMQIRPGVTLLAWMRASDVSGHEAFQHLVELATAVAGGRDPSKEEVARLLGSADANVSLLQQLAGLLPPPCFVEAALRLPSCANPGCTNLEGDSEAGLRRSAAYCSRECQKAHRRAEGGVARGRGK